MSPVPTPNLNTVWLVRLDGTMAGRDCANVLAFLDNTGARTAEQVATDVENALSTALTGTQGLAYQGIITSQKTWTNLHVVRYDADDPDLFDLALSGAEYTGDAAGQMLPPQIAVVITLRTGVASRRARGRLYDYGFTEAATGGSGELETPDRDIIQDFWQDFLGEIGTTTLDWVVLSRGWVNEGPDDPRDSYTQAVYPITSLLVRDQAFDTMRSRVS